MNKEKITYELQDTLVPYTRKYLNNKRILDVGCGTGLAAVYLQKKLNAKFHLLDIEDLRDKKAKNLPFVLGSADKLPFKAGEFEVAYIQFLLHHLPKKIHILKVISEALRVADKSVIVEEVKTARTIKKTAMAFDKKINNILHPGSKYHFNKYYSASQIKLLMTRAHLKVDATRVMRGNKENGYLDTYVFIITK